MPSARGVSGSHLQGWGVTRCARHGGNLTPVKTPVRSAPSSRGSGNHARPGRGVCVCVCEWGGAGWEGQHCTRQRGCQHDPGRPEATGLRAGSLRQPPAQPSPSPTASCGATPAPAPAPAGGRGGGQGQPRRRQTTAAAAAAAGPPSPRRPRPGRRGRLRSAGRSRGRGGGGAHPRPAGAPPPARPPRRQHSRRQSWVT